MDEVTVNIKLDSNPDAKGISSGVQRFVGDLIDEMVQRDLKAYFENE